MGSWRSTDLQGSPMSSNGFLSVSQSDFKGPGSSGVRIIENKRERAMEKFLYQKILKTAIQERNSRENSCPGNNFVSTSKEDFAVRGFGGSQIVVPVRNYPYALETPITYWSAERRKIQGVTTGNSIPDFHRSATFSKCLDERLDEPNNV